MKTPVFSRILNFFQLHLTPPKVPVCVTILRWEIYRGCVTCTKSVQLADAASKPPQRVGANIALTRTSVARYITNGKAKA